MPKPSIRAIQRLYAMSGNRCAFSGCTALIIEDSPGMAGINMGEICHIRASKAGGERYDPDQTDVERHGYGTRSISRSSIMNSPRGLRIVPKIFGPR